MQGSSGEGRREVDGGVVDVCRRTGSDGPVGGGELIQTLD